MVTLEKWQEFADAVEAHIRDYTIPQYGDYPDDQMSTFTDEDILTSIQRYENRRGKGARGIEEEMRDCLKIAHYRQCLHKRDTPRVEGWQDYALELRRGNGRNYTIENACEHWHKLKEVKPMTASIKRIPILVQKSHQDAIMPEYKSQEAAGFDLASCENVEIGPYERKKVNTGLRMAIPAGYELSIRPRSGLALKGCLLMPNSPGTVDSDYRGDIGLIFLNQSPYATTIEKGQRVAQGVLAPIVQGDLIVTEELPETERGSGGFGSTGV